MIKNYLTVALRNITKHKFFSIINIAGLTIGIAASLFIVMYIHDELNYDHIHEKGDRMYRVGLRGKLAGQEIFTSNTCIPMSKALVEEIPEVEEAIRVRDMGEWIFRYDEKAFNEEGIVTSDSNFFEFFSFKLLAGDPETALKNPSSIVINEELAEKYFGSEPALDKTLSIGNNKQEYLVTGVMEKIPANSHIKFNAILSSTSFSWLNQSNWLSNGLWTYYILQEGAEMETVDAKLEPLTERNVTPVLKEFMGKTLDEFRQEGGVYEYSSMPMYDIHLRSELQDESEPPSDMNYVIIMGAIGVFIILIACINFMNLTTAKSAGRAKEVGLRKTLGSLRQTLVIQFLVESTIYAVTASLLALVVVYALLPYFNTLSGKLLTIHILKEPAIIGLLAGLTLFVGLLAGSYPAFYLTSFRITEVLKGKLRAGMKSGGIRSFLVTFQFWISIMLMICTAIVFQQLAYVQNKNLGIDKEHVIMLEDTDRLEKNKKVFKDQLEMNTSIAGVSYSNNMVPGINNTTIFREQGNDADHIMCTYFADYDHLEALGFEMIEGRFFSPDFPADSGAALINEAAVRELGWDNPLEEKLISFDNDRPEEMQVVGVMKDYNFEGLKVDVRPLVLRLTDTGNILYVRFSGERPGQVIDYMEGKWNELTSGEPLLYTFLDEDFDALFRAEQRLGTVFTVFTGIAIFIACLGLFGLAAFTAEQRTKEIGVRKVMGASVWSITALMSKDFVKLVILAFILAVYPSYYFMEQWLEGFANRVEPDAWVFIMAGLLAFVIAWCTVSFQSFKAARVDPVNSLRYE